MQGIIVLSSKSTEWLLPWWKINYLMNNATPVLFLGNELSSKAKKWANTCASTLEIPDYEKYPAGSLSRKFLALQHSPFEKTLLLEPHMQVRGDISGVFDFLSSDTPLITTAGDPNDFLLIQKGHPLIDQGLKSCRLGKKTTLASLIEPHETLILPAVYNWPLHESGENPFSCITNNKGKHLKPYIKGQIKLLENMVFMKVSFPKDTCQAK